MHEHGNEAAGLDEDREVVCTEIPLGTLHVTHRSQKSLCTKRTQKKVSHGARESNTIQLHLLICDGLTCNLTVLNYSHIVISRSGSGQVCYECEFS